MSAVIGKVTTAPVVDSLALLALKVAPDVFDLSSLQYHASIRDQIVRAQLLVRDLCRADDKFRTVLVVGAGVAGITAAMAAAAEGKHVVVVGVEDAPFALQAGVSQRFVGPFMYEWPSSFSGDQSYPPTDKMWPAGEPHTPTWTAATPIAADALAAQLVAWLTTAMTAMANPPAFWLQADRWSVKAFVTDYARHTGDNMLRRLKGLPPVLPLKPALTLDYGYTRWTDKFRVSGPVSVVPDYVILAAGMGEETVELPPGKGVGAKGLRFWADDDLTDDATTGKHIGLFGGGDGALQDALRILTGLDDPLDILRKLHAKPAVHSALKAVMPQLLVIEQQSRLAESWRVTPGGFEQMDHACRAIASALAAKTKVRRRVHDLVRPGNGTVRHFVKGNHFGKAYLLNRFLGHLFDLCRQATTMDWTGRMDYRLVFDAEAIDSRPASPPHSSTQWVKVQYGTGKAATFETLTFDLVVVRFGLEKDSIPGLQMVQISDRDKGLRTSLAHVPVPFVAA